MGAGVLASTLSFVSSLIAFTLLFRFSLVCVSVAAVTNDPPISVAYKNRVLVSRPHDLWAEWQCGSAADPKAQMKEYRCSLGRRSKENYCERAWKVSGGFCSSLVWCHLLLNFTCQIQSYGEARPWAVLPQENPTSYMAKGRNVQPFYREGGSNEPHWLLRPQFTI